jgi:membrane protein implicated in regulation of membrane protease activity
MPECGLPRKGHSKSEAIDPLYLMPKHVIVTFRNGAVAVMACLIAIVVGMVLMLLLDADRTVLSIGMLGFSIAWVIAVWQITPAFDFRQAVRRGFSQTSQLRRAARWMQFAWPAAAVCVVILAMFAGTPNFPTGMVQLALLGFVLLGLTGLIVVSLLFEELADWTCDDTAEKFFRGSQWGMACGALIIVLAMLSQAVMPNALFTAVLQIASLFAAFMLLLSIGFYLYALLSLSKSVTLSLYHANEHYNRIRRREERLREQEQREERLRRQAEPQ